MSESKANKFEFDTDFFEVSVSTGDTTNRPPRTMQEAEQRGYDRGMIEGQQQAVANNKQQITQHLNTLQQALSQAQASHEQFCDLLQKQVLGLVRTTLKMIGGHLAENYPEELLDHHLRACVDQARQGQTITLYLHPSARDYHQKLQSDQITINDVPLLIATSPHLAPTDCLLEWSNGGVEAQFADILKTLDSQLESLGAGIAPEAPPKAAKTAPVPPAEPKAPEAPAEEPTPKTEASAEPEAAATPAEPEAPAESAQPVDPHKQKVDELLGDEELIDALKPDDTKQEE